MSHVKNVFVAFAFVMILAMFSSCTQIKAGLESPMPPPESLQLQADVMDSANIGGKMVHFSWTPPDENSNIDLVVIESAEDPQGPWMEIAASRPYKGFYQEKGSIFRVGRIYYFRVFLTRGGDQTKATKPIKVLITD